MFIGMFRVILRIRIRGENVAPVWRILSSNDPLNSVRKPRKDSRQCKRTLICARPKRRDPVRATMQLCSAGCQQVAVARGRHRLRRGPCRPPSGFLVLDTTETRERWDDEVTRKKTDTLNAKKAQLSKNNSIIARSLTPMRQSRKCNSLKPWQSILAFLWHFLLDTKFYKIMSSIFCIEQQHRGYHISRKFDTRGLMINILSTQENNAPNAMRLPICQTSILACPEVEKFRRRESGISVKKSKLRSYLRSKQVKRSTAPSVQTSLFQSSAAETSAGSSAVSSANQAFK